ncbi:MAG: hypothetical protein ACOCUI_04470 [bacterium]
MKSNKKTIDLNNFRINKKTKNQENKLVYSVIKNKKKIEEDLLDEIYKNIKTKNYIDIDLGFDWDMYVDSKEFQLCVDISTSFLENLKNKRYIKNFNYVSEERNIDTGLGGSLKYMKYDWAVLIIELDPIKFKKIYKNKKSNGEKLNSSFIDVSKFDKYLDYKKIQPQQAKLVNLFFKKPNKWISGEDITRIVSDLENDFVNGGKLVSKLRKILKNKKMLENKNGFWRIKV